MKLCGVVLVFVLGATLRAVAAPTGQDPSASRAVDTNAIPSKLESLQPAAKEKTEIYRAGNMSSRPWTEIVGWHPGASQFPDAQNHEPQLTLISVGFGRENHRSSAISARTTQP